MMAKRSVKADKNEYFLSRERAGLTREAAAELLDWIGADRIERIENGRSPIKPDEVLRMAECYKDAKLCNYFCANDCPIGQEYVPEIELKSLSQITLEMLATLNSLANEKDRLIEITVDGIISEDEKQDFIAIQQRLDEMSIAIDSLKLWVSSKIDSGELSEDILAT